MISSSDRRAAGATVDSVGTANAVSPSLTARASVDRVERARTLAARLAPFWTEVAPKEGHRGFLERTLDVAAGLESPDVASILLRPFTLERVTPRAAAKLVTVCERYGFSWCQPILDAWTAERHGDPARRVAWTASLPDVCRTLCARGSQEGLEVARWLVANRWAAVLKQWKAARDLPNPSAIAAAARELNRPILGLLDSSLVTADAERHAHILRTVLTPDNGYPLDGLVQLLRTADEIRPRNDLQTLGLSDLHAYCVEALGARLLQPVRADGDWSLAVSCQCKCRLCGTLSEFLRDPTRQHVDWPLAKDQRSHVHHIIDSHDLPVSHVTRRVGRPFTRSHED